jgi:thiamine-phosphate pyrophosphorylase
MRIVVISPESQDPRELAAMEGFFSAGLERYHVRKPHWAAVELESWLAAIPEAGRRRIILHQHHPLASKLGLAGVHAKDADGDHGRAARSRSCHSLESLRRNLPLHETLIFGPVFPSLTKKGYGPPADFPWDELKSVLGQRSQGDARVLAIGGVTAAGFDRCRDLGFDGGAVLGAVWNEHDPVAAYIRLRDAAAGTEAKRHAA